jgi:hypothetical protein
VGLPLQRSLFREVGRAGDVLDRAGILPGCRVPAWIDERGDLHLDRAGVQRLAADLPARLTPERLEALRRAHQAACTAIVETGERCARAARSLDEAEARRWLGELGAHVAGLVPYGILSKFVPDALLRALAAAGDGGAPPFPERSAGAALTADLLALFLDCRARGYPPERLEAEWPAVAAEVAARVRGACDRLAGFGPLAWDAPGYEQPRYVFRVLRAAFGQVDPDELRRRLAAKKGSGVLNSTPDPFFAAGGGDSAAALRRALAFWLDFLERETWYVRRAFYRGLVPLLRRLAAGYRRRHPEFRPDDMLFLAIDELTAGGFDPAAVRARRETYLADREYLARHGVEPDRLGPLLEEE